MSDLTETSAAVRLLSALRRDTPKHGCTGATLKES